MRKFINISQTIHNKDKSAYYYDDSSKRKAYLTANTDTN